MELSASDENLLPSLDQFFGFTPTAVTDEIPDRQRCGLLTKTTSHSPLLNNKATLKQFGHELKRKLDKRQDEHAKNMLVNNFSHFIHQHEDKPSEIFLEKVLFIWENFHQARTCEIRKTLLKSCNRHLSQLINNKEFTIAQRFLRILMSVCQRSGKIFPDLCFDDEELLRVSSILTNITFSTQVYNEELSSLAGTALCIVWMSSKVNVEQRFLNVYEEHQPVQFGHIALCSGVINCNKGLAQGLTQSFLIVLLKHICHLCQIGLSDFHSFNCLSSFWSSSLISDLHWAEINLLIQITLPLLWAHSDSPVDRVPDHVTACFEQLACCAFLHRQEEHKLLATLTSDLLMLPWTVKGKLRMLTVLIPRIDAVQLLTEHPSLISDALQCLSSNYLAAACSKLYAELLKQITADFWLTRLLEPVLTALISDNHLVRYNMNQYCLPATLQRFPDINDDLVQWFLLLDHKASQLVGIMSIYKVCKKLGLLLELSTLVLEDAFISSNDEVRGNAFAVICTTSKKADNVRVSELELLQSHLPDNLSVDCPAFRHQLLSCVKTWLARLSHSIINYKKLPYAADICDIEQLIAHIDWLQCLCIDNLRAGSNYQRKETVLKMLDLLLSSIKQISNCTFQTLSTDPVCRVKNLCTEREEAVITRLLVLIDDSSSEIQELVYRCLSNHFSQQSLQSIVTQLIVDADTLCQSSKASAAESGAVIAKLLIHRQLVASRIQFLSQMLEKMSDAVDKVLADFKAVLSVPHVYGYLVALKRIVDDTNFVSQCSTDEVKLLCDRIVSVCEKAVYTVLSLLSLSCHVKESCPSFEEMETAIYSLISEPTQDKEFIYDEAMAWCWLTLKECCNVCGSLGKIDLMTWEEAERVQAIFFSVLTRCRHRGVIEGCVNGLILFVTSMLNSSNLQLKSLPSKLVDQVLRAALSADGIKGSVTRRSAGLPILMQCVLSSEHKAKQRSLFQLVLPRLICAGKELPDSQMDETLDLPAMHAMNIMKSLVVDASLSLPMRTFLADITKLAIEGFTSHIWAVNNAALQLFAACSQRLIGQKRQSDGSIISTSAGEFFSFYPSLHQYLLSKLERAATVRLCSEIFPVLSILSALSSCNLTLSSPDSSHDLSVFTAHLKCLLSSPVLVVRRLAATAIPCTLDKESITTHTKQLLSQLHFGAWTCNLGHGLAMTLRCLINDLLSRKSQEMNIFKWIIGELSSHADQFLRVYAQCDVIRNSYLLLIDDLLTKHKVTGVSLQLSTFVHLIDSVVDTKVSPGEACMKETAVRIICQMSSSDDLYSLLHILIARCETDLVDIILTHVLENGKNLSSTSKDNLQMVLYKLAVSERTAKHVGWFEKSVRKHGVLVDHHTCCECLNYAMSQVDAMSKVDDKMFLQHCLPLAASLAMHMRNEPDLDNISEKLQQISQSSTEESRLACCDSILIIFRSLHGCSYSLSRLTSYRLLTALLTLLQDEITEIRQEACLAAGFLLSDNQLGIHHTVAIRKLLHQIPHFCDVTPEYHMQWIVSLVKSTVHQTNQALKERWAMEALVLHGKKYKFQDVCMLDDFVSCSTSGKSVLALIIKEQMEYVEQATNTLKETVV